MKLKNWMIKKLSIPQIGMRSIKTAISATIIAIIYILIDRNATFACIGAVFGMENEEKDSYWKTGGDRIIGTIFGGFLGIGLFFLHQQTNSKLLQILLLCIGIILLILISQFVCCPGAIQGGAVVFYIVMLNTQQDEYILYAINRMIDTAVGVTLSVIINVALSRERIENLKCLKK